MTHSPEEGPHEGHHLGPAATGIPGLDQILRGGLPRDEMHLVQGAAGTGKTTLALQFLLAGVQAGEAGLYITLSQTREGLEVIARSHGLDIESIGVHELFSKDVLETDTGHQTVLHTADVELGELGREIRELVTRLRPQRLVFDSIEVIGLLAGEPVRYRREIVMLRRFLAGSGCTTLFISDWPITAEGEISPNSEFHSLSASIVQLEQCTPDYGEVRRRLRALKVRGVPFRGGYHNFRIVTGGLEVYPRLEVDQEPEFEDFRPVPSGIAALDELLGGGLDLGTACLFVGPPGSGKSTLAACFVSSAAKQGYRSSVFLFDERPETFKARSRDVGVPLETFLQDGTLELVRPETARITPGEFAQRVRASVVDKQTRLVVIDSLTGYFNAMTDATMLPVQMHELLGFLSRRGVLTLLLIARQGIMSVGSTSSVDLSWLSDSILLFQQFEAEGKVRRCIAAIKKRLGEHETTLRELCIRTGGVTVGSEPLHQFHHLLDGQIGSRL